MPGQCILNLKQHGVLRLNDLGNVWNPLPHLIALHGVVNVAQGIDAGTVRPRPLNHQDLQIGAAAAALAPGRLISLLLPPQVGMQGVLERLWLVASTRTTIISC